MPAKEPQKKPEPTPPAKPATPAPVPPPPAAPAAPARPFRSLDDDLADIAGPRPPAARRPGRPTAKAQEPPPPPGQPDPDPAAPTEPAAAPVAPPTDSGEDYLLGSVAPPGKAKDATDGSEPEPITATGPLKAPELRAEYAKVKKRVGELEKELATIKAATPKAVDDAERTAFTEQISALKKQLDETSGALKTVAYEHSEEYQSKYQKPFVDAWNEGVALVSGLTIMDEEGNARKGTAEDFQRIMAVPDNEAAATMAQEMFGANSFYVLSQRRDIQNLNNQRMRVLNEYRSTLSEREKAQAEKAKKDSEEREAHRIQEVALFRKHDAEAAEKYPELFAPIPGDDEGNAILARGFRDADLGFFGAQDLPAQRRVALHSALRNRAAAFGRLVHQLKGKDAKIAELQKELDEIKGSTPGSGQVGREAQGTKRLTAEEEIEAAATQYR